MRWSPNGREVERGRWVDPRNGAVHLDAGGLDTGRVVTLAHAWARGADAGDAARHEAFASDPANLLPVEARLDRQKGARGPLAWLPPKEGFPAASPCRAAGGGVRARVATGARARRSSVHAPKSVFAR